MHTTRDLRQQIRSITGTAQITNAMQMVAASKMRKAQQAAVAGRPFSHLLYRIQRRLTTQAIDFKHPLLETREIHKRAILLIAGDKGLCGALNSNLFRLASEFDIGSTVFIAAGRKAAQFIARSGRQLAAEFPYGDAPRYAEARTIAAFARDMFLKREVDQVQVVATRFINTLSQQPICAEFLPIGEIKGFKVEGAEPEAELAAHTTEFLFEPGPEVLLGIVLPHFLDLYLYEVLLNAKASEHSARMVAMKNATDNANNLIKDLTLELNKLRQGNITKELLDLAAGEAGSA
jgi:F-type H+-transporting ATPase subunit gamma